MRTHLNIRFFLGTLLFFTVNLSAQSLSESAGLKDYLKNYIEFSKTFPQEKVYLHFDNTEYFQGETMWFKAYVVRADRNSLSDLSTVLYVELISSEGNLVDSKKLKIENGVCAGEFNIKPSTYGGFYEVRAYTRYMLNFGENNFFSRVFAVYDTSNGDKKPERKITERPRHLQIPQVRPVYSQKEKLLVNFFPEGGNLVQGIPSQVAFKVTGSDGENEVISGSLYDGNNNRIADINSEYNGMGAFPMIPDDEKYYVKFAYKNKDYTFQLPDILKTGYVMNVNNFNKEIVSISIQKSTEASSDTLGLSISCRGILYSFEKIIWNNESAALLSFNKKTLPSGVNQITLFNSEGKILAQRSIFINHHSEMKMQAIQNKPNYQPFEKIALKFILNDKNDNPIQTDFSLAVRDASNTAINPYSNNILSDLLLTSDLKGYIYNPAYYFEKDDRAHIYALDLLMLTQGFTRYNWEQMTDIEPFAVKQPMEKGLYIEGTVSSLVRKKPKPDVNVLMFLTGDSTSQHGRTKTDSLGRFNFSIADFYGKHNLSIQTTEKDKRKDNNVMLDRVFSPPYKIYAYREKQIPDFSANNGKNNLQFTPEDSIANAAFMDSLMRNNQQNEKIRMLGDVTVKDKKIFKLEGEGMNNASIVYNVQQSVDDLIDSGKDEPYDVVDFLEKSNPYFSFDLITSIDPQKANDRYKIKATYKGKNVIFVLDNRSLLIGFDTLDKKPMSDYDELTSFSLKDITALTIIEEEGRAFLASGTRGMDSLKGNEVLVYLYTDKDKRYNSEIKGIRQTKMQGYSMVKEFYNVPYDIFPQDLSDHRRTLYWNPNVKTDKEGMVMVTFFNSASCTIMNINAQTVTQNGIIGTLNE